MSVRLEDTIYLHFGTASASTGAATDADSLPVCTVEEDGTAMGYSPTVTNVATGLYRVTIACTTGNGFEAGRRYSVYAVVTVGSITGRDGIGEFLVESAVVDDVYGRIGAPAGASIAADLVVIDNFVDDLESRVIGTIAAGTHSPQSGDAYARLGAPAGASIAADLVVIDNFVDNLEARVIGTIAAGTHSPQSGDAYARLGAPAGASIAADLLEIDNFVDEIESRITALRAGYLDNLAGGAVALASGVVVSDKTGFSLSAAGIDDILDEVVEGTETLRQLVRLFRAVLFGKSDGGGTATRHFRDLADAKNRITATVDVDGNRTAVTPDGT